jgi:hypothetical protein
MELNYINQANNQMYFRRELGKRFNGQHTSRVEEKQ